MSILRAGRDRRSYLNISKDLLFDEAAEAYFVIFSQTANDTSTITVRVSSSLRIPFHVYHFCSMVMPLDTSLYYPRASQACPSPAQGLTSLRAGHRDHAIQSRDAFMRRFSDLYCQAVYAYVCGLGASK